ncbi:MAG: sugar ABC transporter permease [Lachnospiraceae bacterium]|nr:sugar ABC transporter permease [Lachnospiraceae bacterium]MBQ7864357.1 sugar ABC transporter permease [Lachnospiraceae bacterium]MBQ8633414.1 sugar ABC transporter permease [Lachnospiraceae bacterium]
MVDNKQQWKAWLYLSPAIVLLLVFTLWPIINTVRMAFLENYKSLEAAGGATFEFGIGNFIKVIQYKRFLTCLKNTVLLCVLTVPLSTILALLIAVALNSIKPLQRFLQTIFFLPYVTNSIAIGMVFAAMFNIVGAFYGTEQEIIVTAGIINNVIQFFGGEPINWINYGSTYAANITVMTIYIVWNALPFKILVLLGGLQSINKQYYDAAKVDGTSRKRIFTRITVPLLSPMIAYVVITGFIGGFKEYTSIVGIFGEKMGPADDAYRLNTMVGFIYDALSQNNQGRASAAALILFGIILVVTMINGYVSKKRVHF